MTDHKANSGFRVQRRGSIAQLYEEAYLRDSPCLQIQTENASEDVMTNKDRRKLILKAIAWVVFGITLTVTGSVLVYLAARDVHVSPDASNMVGPLAVGMALVGIFIIVGITVDVVDKLRRRK